MAAVCLLSGVGDTALCRDVLEGGLLLMGVEDTTWNSMKVRGPVG